MKRQRPLRSATLGVLVALAAVLSARAAGDLLRRGAPAPAPATAGAGTPAEPAATAQMRANAADSLARTTRALQSVQAMQAAARALAAAGPNHLGPDPRHPGQTLPEVPDGLAAGGLAVAPGGVWTGAGAPTQAVTNGQTTVGITQTAAQAILTWRTFNVGRNTTLNFDQSAGGADVGQWVAFNKIADPSGVPSQILGAIKAQGQVYVVNQNGIIFGGSSQVNAHALVASALPINDNLIARGLLNNPDQQFLFSALPVAAGPSTAAFSPPAAATGDVTVQPGAQLTAPTSADHVGGRVALVGLNVTNGGTISTPDGQTILAAGLQVGLAAHSSADPSLRGLDVFVGAVADASLPGAPSGGVAVNAGLISAPRASVVLVGRNVSQLGGVDGGTSVAFNGRVDLLADYDAVSSGGAEGLAPFFPRAAGLVTLGPGSVTRVLPELDSPDRVVGTKLTLASQLNLRGLAVHLAEDATLLAPGAAVAISAGDWSQDRSGRSYFGQTAGQVYLSAGARIDVAGTVDALVSVADNIIEAQLRGAELANSPLQRDGPLRGLTVRVDARQTGTYNGSAWVGTPLADVSGYVALIQRSVGELTVDGGTVSLRAGESVVMQPGSAVNVSGGWISYQGANVATTKLLVDGRVVDIAQATPDRIYTGVAAAAAATTDPKWGVTATSSRPLLGGGAGAASDYEPGYVQGGNGGTLAITAPAMALDGALLGATVAGPRQRAARPVTAALALSFLGQQFIGGAKFADVAPAPPAVRMAGGEAPPPAGGFALDGTGVPLPLRAERQASFVLDPARFGDEAFGQLSLDNRDGSFVLPPDTEIMLPPGGLLDVRAADIAVEGRVLAPGGTLNFTAPNIALAVQNALDPNAASPPSPDPARGRFRLGPAAMLSTAGLVVDDRSGVLTAGVGPLVTVGGSIVIKAYSAELAAGSLLDVSGGVVAGATGRFTYGNGGSISIAGGQDPGFSGVLGGALALGAELRGLSGAKGGTLRLLAPLVQVGGSSANPDVLLLGPDFFSAGGFSAFTIAGLGLALGPADQFVSAVLIADGTALAPAARRWVASDTGAAGLLLIAVSQPVGVRPAVSVTLSAQGVPAFRAGQPPLSRGDLVFGAGAVLQVDPAGAVALTGDTVTVLGTVSAPGGSITVSGGKDSLPLFFSDQSQALATVALGADSVLSAAGVTVPTPDARGLRTGTVLAGGKIAVSGNISAATGALLDVSGTADTLDLPSGYGGQGFEGGMAAQRPVPTRVESNGGSVTLNGGQALLSDATLRGAAGGVTAAGGMLTVSSGRFYAVGSSPATPLDVTLEVVQSGLPLGQATVGQGLAGDSLGHFAADRFNGSGFDSLTLRGTVRFSGPVAINTRASLRVADGGVIYADAAVALTAGHVALGTALQPPLSAAQQQQQASAFTVQGHEFYFSPVFGAGGLDVSGRLVEVGNLSLQGIGRAELVASGGDIRGGGTLDIAGDLTLRAGQIYPPTATVFTIAAHDYTVGGVTRAGSVTVGRAGGDITPPLSAGGTLNLRGSAITQGGVLRAPLGTINLGGGGAGTVDQISNQPFATTQRLTLAPDSVTSVSAQDSVTGRALTIPYGTNSNGTAWLNPAGDDITAGGIPAKSVNLSAANLAVEAGATADISGGGDLYAYRFVAGTGGTRDVLAATSSFAILPGHAAEFAPVDPGYANTGLAPGDRIFLNASAGFAAGEYTLLPARYALLPGAFLVTPQTSAPAGTTSKPDGASVVAGRRFNSLGGAPARAGLFASFEVAPAAVVRKRAQYDDYSANAFLRAGALANGSAATRLPVDAGQLVLAATQTMAVQGAVAARAPAGGRGGLVDISSPVDILIAGADATAPSAGTLVLDAAKLGAFGAESLLIGGVRKVTATGTVVTVSTANLGLDNAGTSLVGPDIILVASQNLTLVPGAALAQSGALSGPADTLLLGSAAIPGSGNGVLVRVSADATAGVLRAGVTTAGGPVLTVGAGAQVTGVGVTLDSTRATALDPAAVLAGDAVALSSGRISVQLESPGPLQPAAGLVLSGGALQNLQTSARTLSLLSYSSVDLYGVGQIGSAEAAGLALRAAELRGFNQNGGMVTLAAREITLDNSAGGGAPGTVAAATGTLVLEAATLRLGSGALALDQFGQVTLNAAAGLLAQGKGTLSAPGALTINTPLITGATAAIQVITAGGELSLNVPAARRRGGAATVAGGLGAQLTLTGASVAADTDIALPSGVLAIRATTGDLIVAGRLDVGGRAQAFSDVTRFTDAGTVSLIADAGNVSVAESGIVNVAARSGGGSAGGLTVVAATGAFTLSGTLLGTGGSGGKAGAFSLDAGGLATLAMFDAALDEGGFTRARSFRARGGDVTVDGTATARNYSLSADNGSITVSGTIDAAGPTGGAVSLAAQGSVTLLAGARLTVAAQNFSSAGKGGAISLEAGAARDGVTNPVAVVDIQAGAAVDLSVTANTTASAALGQQTGTLHLRAPQNAAATDLQVAPINGSIAGASSIVIEGYKLTDLTAATSTITATVQNNVKANGTAFGNATAAITARLLANNAALTPVLHVQPGAEIINRTGNLVLVATWDLSTFRFGPGGEPGLLTLRAAGNLNFLFRASLSDGFSGATFASPLLAAGARSWSYRLVAGADLAAADFRAVRPLAALATGTGSLQLGLNAIPLPTAANNSRQSIIPNFFQVIRTGTGDLDLAAGRDVLLLNPLAAIYTAGTQAPAMPNFELPILEYQNSNLGTAQLVNLAAYPAQYTFAGGDIRISAQNDIARFVLRSGALVAESTRELPNNWLYRRGYVNPATGQFDRSNAGGEIQSISWWVDFSNYFEGVGALGGGNVTLAAGRDVSNVDAAVPTNARMPKVAPSAAALLELGGGDLTVRAGRDLDGGVYYVERGQGTLAAGRSIRTNATRAALTQTDLSAMGTTVPDAMTWLPTTLFAGKASFEVMARDDLLLGPVANPFWLPQGINNSFYQKTYFSTYAPDTAVAAASLVGTVTLRASPAGGMGSLSAWFQNALLFTGNPKAFAQSQPWLRLAETNLAPFATGFMLMPPALRATAFAGDLNLVGTLTLAPSPTGELELNAVGAINGLRPNSLLNPAAAASVTNPYQWATAVLNLSDADPARLPGAAAPLSLPTASNGRSGSTGLAGSWSLTSLGIFDGISALFAESGSFAGARGVIQSKQALHAAGPLHAGDPEPVRLVATQGDISGLTLYAGKPARVAAGRDLTDLALYVQNNGAGDLTRVVAGRDLVAYAPTTPLRLAAQASGNALLVTGATGPAPGGGNPTAGDIQLGGPGLLQVFAGRNLDLGVGPNAADGTAVGIATIGNARNPALPFEGAGVVAGAGLGGAAPDLAGFAGKFLDPATGGALAARYLPVLAAALGLDGADGVSAWAAFLALPEERRLPPALAVFYRVLRDAGREHHDAASPGDQFQSGFAAIAALFPDAARTGDISLTSRGIKTASGGGISLLAPGGQLTVGFDIAGNQAADQGILTAHGGNIAIFTHESVIVGTSRIFTLRGGDEVIWSSAGNIAAGAASKTVQSAPPTRVLIDPQSGDVRTDLAGLATGGGIGVLATVAGVPPGDVDLIAPAGTVDAGDAGIRSSGRLNVAAVQVLNAANIAAGGGSAGVPAPPAAPSIGGVAVAAASTAAAASGAATAATTRTPAQTAATVTILPSIITVEVLGYGGGEGDSSERENGPAG